MQNPLTGSTRSKRYKTGPVTTPTGADGSIIKYRAVGATCIARLGAGGIRRLFTPGFGNGLATSSGPIVVSCYSTGVFKPGTKISWEPSLSPTSGGRIFVGFTDNIEVMKTIIDLFDVYNAAPTLDNYSNYATGVKGLGNVVSHPAWMEFDTAVPLRLRRKMFDVQNTMTVTNLESLDRSVQTAMFVAFEGLAGIGDGAGIGSFVYQDVVSVEGLHSVAVV